jgi:hypothetical protein
LDLSRFERDFQVGMRPFGILHDIIQRLRRDAVQRSSLARELPG